MLNQAPSALQVVYVREGVAVWPTKTERIMGRLSLIEQHQVLFLAWLPYGPGMLNEDGTWQQVAPASPDKQGAQRGGLGCCASC